MKKNLPRAKQLLKKDPYYQGYCFHYGIDTAINYALAQFNYEQCKIGDKFYGKTLNQLGLLHQTRTENYEKCIQIL